MRPGVRARLGAGVLVLGLAATGASADDHTDFVKGDWTLELTASGVYGTGGNGSSVGGGGVGGATAGGGVGYYFADNWSLYAGLTGSYFHQERDNNNVAGTEAEFLLRWHFFNCDRWSVFLDGGIGLIYFDSDWPTDGTRWNVNPVVGIGATYQVSEKAFLVGGIRYFHISNGSVEGDDRNPSMNGGQVYAGLILKL